VLREPAGETQVTTTLIPAPPATGRALWRATLIGTVLQVAMVVGGHYVPAIKSLFAPGGMLISAFAGWLFGRLSRGPRALSTVGGLFAGAACAFLGILESFYLGDVPTTLLLLGTASSAVTGALGGLVAGWAKKT
jgi:hypothetical protein